MNMLMENFDEVIFEDDEFDELPKPEGNESPKEPTPPELPDEDLTTEVLRLKGITDPDKIKFEDETGAIVERAWDSLSREELINILSNLKESELNDLTDSEIQLINSIRESGLTTEEYLLSLQPKAEEQTITRYNVDELSDDEVYALDLLHKVGSDISDEEIDQALELAKLNENLFKKTVEGLRKEYIRLLEEEETKIANELAAKKQEEYANFSNTINLQILGLNSFAGLPLELSNDDIEDLSSFMLDLDDSGMSAFGKAMRNPELFTKAAFWLLNEDKIVEELNRLIQDNYRRGYELAKLDLLGGKPKSKLVLNKPTSLRKTTDDVFIEDEDW